MLPNFVKLSHQVACLICPSGNQSSLNPTWHAEIDAIHHLVQQPRDWNGQQLVLYTTAELCPMCQGAILWTGIGTVVFLTSIRFLQRLGWKQMDLQAAELVRRSLAFSCQLIGGILEEECNARFSAANGKEKP